MQRIYIVEDDESIRDTLIYALESAGFAAAGFDQSDGMWAAMKEAAPSLLLLDIMLPGEDGIAVLKRIRQSEAAKKLPVIMLTAKGAEYDRIKGLDLGADDYITKPFSVMELISRIRAVLRRTSDAPEKQLEHQVGGIVLNSEKRTVSVGDREIPLTYKEFELLHYLMLNEGIVLTRDKLLNEVWGFDYNGESRTVDMHVKSLRQKLDESGNSIVTVRNVGYKIGG